MATHQISFRVYYEDTDAGGIVYHGRYLGFAERARTEAIRSVGISVSDLAREEGLVFVVRSAELRYLAPVRLDDEISIETALLEMTRTRLRLSQQFTNVTRGGQPSTNVTVELTCVNLTTLKPTAIPPQWCDLIKKLAAGEV